VLQFLDIAKTCAEHRCACHARTMQRLRTSTARTATCNLPGEGDCLTHNKRTPICTSLPRAMCTASPDGPHLLCILVCCDDGSSLLVTVHS
jgi:hypothetical protein